jgi:hypothetical protein
MCSESERTARPTYTGSIGACHARTRLTFTAFCGPEDSLPSKSERGVAVLPSKSLTLGRPDGLVSKGALIIECMAIGRGSPQPRRGGGSQASPFPAPRNATVPANCLRPNGGLPQSGVTWH